MNIKLNMYISDPERFVREPESAYCYALCAGRYMDKEWIFCTEIEFEVDTDSGKAIEAAKTELNAEIGKHTAAINVLESRKNELLALTHEKAAQVVDDLDFLHDEGEESLEEIASRENHFIDSQERL